jgi:hypothetical protein
VLLMRRRDNEIRRELVPLGVLLVALLLVILGAVAFGSGSSPPASDAGDAPPPPEPVSGTQHTLLSDVTSAGTQFEIDSFEPKGMPHGAVCIVVRAVDGAGGAGSCGPSSPSTVSASMTKLDDDWIVVSPVADAVGRVETRVSGKAVSAASVQEIDGLRFAYQRIAAGRLPVAPDVATAKVPAPAPAPAFPDGVDVVALTSQGKVVGAVTTQESVDAPSP